MLLKSLCKFDFNSVNNLCLERVMFSIRFIDINLKEVNTILLKSVKTKNKLKSLNEEDALKFASLKLLFKNIVE